MTEVFTEVDTWSFDSFFVSIRHGEQATVLRIMFHSSYRSSVCVSYQSTTLKHDISSTSNSCISFESVKRWWCVCVHSLSLLLLLLERNNILKFLTLKKIIHNKRRQPKVYFLADSQEPAAGLLDIKRARAVNIICISRPNSFCFFVRVIKYFGECKAKENRWSLFYGLFFTFMQHKRQ